MKCPICGQQLRPGKKNPDYLLCYNCKKKYKVPQSQEPKQPAKTVKTSKTRETEEQRYANIPPKKVRDKREEEMRRAYDEMLAVGDGKSKKRKSKDSVKASTKKRQRDYDDDLYDDYDDDYGYDDYDEKVSKAPIIILGIAIVVVAAVIAYMLLK